MGMRLRVFLNTEEERTLWELRRATTVPQRVKDRAEVIRMNSRGDYVETIANYMKWHVETVRDTLKRWQKGGLGGLWEGKGRGHKRTWREADLDDIEQLLRTEERTYSAVQLAERLKQERQVSMSPAYLRRLLKKRGLSGSERGIVTAKNKTRSREQLSKPT